MGPLATLFSNIDRAKRYVGGLLSDPVGRIEQSLGQATDDLKQLGLLSNQAYADPKDPFKVTDKQAWNKLTDTYLTSVMNFAPVGMFIGPKAATWDKTAAAKAQELTNKGVDPRQIWKETGTFKGPDGHWRQEISDHNIRPLNRTWGESADLKAGGRTTTVRQRALAHPQLSAAYPDTKQIGVMMKPGESKSASYMSDPDGGLFDDTISLSVSPKYNYKADPSTMLHELQHAIQQREGWASGGNPESMPRLISELIDEGAAKAQKFRDLAYRGDPLDPFDVVKPGALDKALDTEIGVRRLKDWQARLNAFPDSYMNDAYRHLAGEAEARATQARMNLNAAQRRELFPLDSWDVPLDQLIIRGLLD